MGWCIVNSVIRNIVLAMDVISVIRVIHNVYCVRVGIIWIKKEAVSEMLYKKRVV